MSMFYAALAGALAVAAATVNPIALPLAFVAAIAAGGSKTWEARNGG